MKRQHEQQQLTDETHPGPSPNKTQRLSFSGFDLLPVEIVSFILSFTDDYKGVAAQVCSSWRSIICFQQLDNHRPPKLFARSMAKTISLVQWALDNGCSLNENI